MRVGHPASVGHRGIWIVIPRGSGNFHTAFMPLSNASALAGFTAYLKVEKGLRPATVRGICARPRAVCRAIWRSRPPLLIRPGGEMCAVSSNLAVRAMRRRTGKSYDPRSVARKLSALRHFYRYLLLDRPSQHDPTLEHRHAKAMEGAAQDRWRASEVEALARGRAYGIPARGTSRQALTLALRNRAMLEVLYAGGLRVSESVSAKLEDLKLDLGYVLGARQRRQGAHRAAGPGGG